MPTGFEVETKVPENISTVSADFGAEMIDFDDTTHDAARVYFEIDTDNTFPDPVQLDSSADLGLTSQNAPSFKSADGLQPDTDYFVRAQAKNVVFSDPTLFTDADADSVGFREDIVSDRGAMTNLVASQDGMSKVMARSGFMEVFWIPTLSNGPSQSIDFLDADGGYIDFSQSSDGNSYNSNVDIKTDVDVSAASTIHVDWQTSIVAPLDEWSSVSNLSKARTYLSSSLSGGKIYAIGGFDNNFNALNLVEEYDPSSDSWSTVSSMPTARQRLASSTGPNGNIYAIGGRDAYSVVEKYDPSSDSWSTVSSMPTGRERLKSSTDSDGNIYAIGGRDSSDNVKSTVEKYDPSSDSWSTVSSMPTAREELAATTGPNGNIYAIGGVTGGGNTLDTVEKYDPSSDSWSTVSSMPTAREELAASTAPNGNIYAIGGYDSGENATGVVEEYDPSSDSWSTVSSMPTARRQFSTSEGPEGSIYAIAGFDSNLNRVATVERLSSQSGAGEMFLSVGGIQVDSHASISRQTENFDVSSIDGVSNISVGVSTSVDGATVNSKLYDIYLQ